MTQIRLIETREMDYDDYYRIRSSPSDIYWNGYNSKPDYSEFKKIFMSRIQTAPFEKDQDRRIYLVQNEDCCRIGFIQLIRHNDCIEIGYSIVEKYQNKGLAAEALKQSIPIALSYYDCVIVRIRDDNIASQKVAIKNGFTATNNYIEKEYPNVGIVKLRTYYYKP